MNSNLQQQLDKLLTLALEKKATSEQLQKLNTIVQEDPEALQYCLNFYQMVGCLRNNNRMFEVYLEDASNEMNDQNLLLEEYARYEKVAPAIDIPKEEPTRELIQKLVYPPKEKRSLSKLSIASVIVSAAAILMVAAYVHFVPTKTMTATVTDVMNPKWASVTDTLQVGSDLYNTDNPRFLKSGIVQIQLDHGTTVILEGPCTFSCKSGSLLNLQDGRVFAKVPPHATGFTVETPVSRVVDLGTEFGVQVESDGTTLAQVAKGKAKIISNLSAGDAESDLIFENQAKEVNGRTQRIRTIAYNSESYIQSFDVKSGTVWRGQKGFDLADIVGGGSGFGNGEIGWGIHLESGRSQAINAISTQFRGESKYVPVISNAYVDGVFVAGGQNGACQVSTLGHVFQGIPQTSLRYGNNPYNGASHTVAESGQRFQLTLDSQVCGTVENPSIYLHANAGITFDLNRFRIVMTDKTITEFTARCGIADASAEYHSERNSKADFYVLIDGQPRLTRQNMAAGQVEDVVVEIAPEDRFLTLMTTEGLDGSIIGDWTLFCKPMLVFHKD